MPGNLAFLGPGVYWQQTSQTSPRQKHTPQTESELEPWIRLASGTLSTHCSSYAGAQLYIKYIDTPVCPCGMVFHFKLDSAGSSACRKALKAHMSKHEGVHFWDLSASKSSQGQHIRYLNQRYPGAAIIPFERWAVPLTYRGPDNVAQPKAFFFRHNVILPTPPASIMGSTISSPTPGSPLSSLSDASSEHNLDSEEDEDDEWFQNTLVLGKRKRSNSWEDEIFCVCKRPNDGRRYLACDCCDLWFHPSCLGIPENGIDRLDAWYCPACQFTDAAEGYELATQADPRQTGAIPHVASLRSPNNGSRRGVDVRVDPMVVPGQHEISEVPVYEISDDE